MNGGFDDLRSAWRSEAADLPEEHAQQRRTRRERLMNVGAAVMLFAAPLWFLRVDRSAEALLWAAVVWVSTAVALGAYAWHWRGLWRASAATVAEHASVMERRCRARLRFARFGIGLLVVQTVISAAWYGWDYQRGEVSTERVLGAAVILVFLVLGMAVWLRRTIAEAKVELQKILDFQRDFEEGD